MEGELPKPKRKNKGGRPEKISETIISKVCRCIRAGNWVDTSCAFAGISRDTLNEWIKRGRKEKERLDKHKNAKENQKEILYLLLYNSYDKALAEAEVFGVSLIGKAASGGNELTEVKEIFDSKGNLTARTTTKKQMVPQWTAQAWLLERRHPEKWGKRVEINSGKGGPQTDAPITINFGSVDPSKI